MKIKKNKKNRESLFEKKMKNAAYKRRHTKQYKLFKKEVKEQTADMPIAKLTKINDFLPAPKKIIVSHNKHCK